jgi:hypothetical protein
VEDFPIWKEVDDFTDPDQLLKIAVVAMKPAAPQPTKTHVHHEVPLMKPGHQTCVYFCETGPSIRAVAKNCWEQRSMKTKFGSIITAGVCEVMIFFAIKLDQARACRNRITRYFPLREADH